MSLNFKRVGVLALGWTFVLLGIAGLFLPVLQGILFLLIGLAILSSEYVWAHRLLQKLKQRFPSVARYSDAATAKARALMQRFSRKPAEKAAAKE
ncbi:MAG TPA: PGPGW domain-containing protein [Terriglobales bacterium]|nr:PGPGW domain-containing protein [Terriglobales bacterium]